MLRWANEPLLVGWLSHQVDFFADNSEGLEIFDMPWWTMMASMASFNGFGWKKPMPNPGTWGLWGSTFHLCQWHEGGAWMDDGRCSYLFSFISIYLPKLWCDIKWYHHRKIIFQYRERWSYCFLQFVPGASSNTKNSFHSSSLGEKLELAAVGWGGIGIVYRFIGLRIL